MEINLRLLGQVNRELPVGAPVLPRYVATISAEKLSSLLKVERTGTRKGDRYRLKPDSFIQIDKEIQRGRDVTDALLQMPSKIDDIANTLLGVDSAAPVAFLGTLIWNVRPDSATTSLKVISVSELGVTQSLPQFELKISAPCIWLTDSAHRHLGIAEAHRRYVVAKHKYPKFDPATEFVVEIYQLDRSLEKALFFELNALQKRISAAKRKEMDVVSSEGYVKDVIRQVDESRRRLFEDNIEVTSNTNSNHTLMTMSVFAASIREMFTSAQLDLAKKDSDERARMAEYYCDFFYRLSDAIVVEVDGPVDPSTGKSSTLHVKPYRNLFSTIIQPVVNEITEQELSEAEAAKKLDAVREEAKRQNSMLRSQDLANHNATIRALCRIARDIRKMDNWEKVIDSLQTRLVLSSGGRFFQKSNPELLNSAVPGEAPIARLNEDGSINMQVVSQTIRAMTNYLRCKLLLDFEPEVRWIPIDEAVDPIVLPVLAKAAPLEVVLSKKDGGTVSFSAAFFALGKENPVAEEQTVRLEVSPIDDVDWKDLTRLGSKKIIATTVSRDAGYVHDVYGDDVRRYVAEFSATLGGAPKNAPSVIPCCVKLHVPEATFRDVEFAVNLRLT